MDEDTKTTDTEDFNESASDDSDNDAEEVTPAEEVIPAEEVKEVTPAEEVKSE